MAVPGGESGCPGGLLCEARRALLGWRVPVGCRAVVERAQVASCRMVGVDLGRVREFFESRYRVVPLLDLADEQGFAVVPKRESDALSARLHVIRRIESVELVALAGELTAPTD
jgi:hypothetical protein